MVMRRQQTKQKNRLAPDTTGMEAAQQSPFSSSM
jgi:hypothetical protein